MIYFGSTASLAKREDVVYQINKSLFLGLKSEPKELE